MATRRVTAALVLTSFLTVQALGIAQTNAEQLQPCRCLENGGEPGPGDCPCNVEQCFGRCVDDLCPGTPNCMLECSIRCSCNSAPLGCVTHVDPGPTPTSAPGVFTVSVCYSEFPTSSCSPLHTPFHSPTLEGPIPEATSRAAEFDEINFRHQFANLPPGNYVVRTDGCNPFGCYLDTPVFVVDQDIQVQVRQLGPQTPTPARSPTPTLTMGAPCLGDGNADSRVTIEELVGAVANALAGCPQ